LTVKKLPAGQLAKKCEAGAKNEDNGADTGDAMEVWTIRRDSSTPRRLPSPRSRKEQHWDDKEHYNRPILRVPGPNLEARRRRRVDRRR
jgi:hypothetical protein